jgi:nicotinamide-nucleotide amidase
MKAHVLSIGSELILGHLTDTNATFLAQELVGLGVELRYVTQVGDDLGLLIAALDRARADADLVICTGGVGPTEDDLTREAIAALVGETSAIDPDLLVTLKGFFAARGAEMPERNAKQAWLIPSAETLPNPIGTAPGWFVRAGETIVVAMPGVPREMYRMWREQARPRVLARLPHRVFATTTLKTLGIGESAAEDQLKDLVGDRNPVVATYAKDDGVHVRVTATADTADAAARLRDTVLADVRHRLGRYVYAADDQTLPSALVAALAARGLTIGVAECGTGGRFAGLLSSEPAASSVLRGALSFPTAPDRSETATDLAHRALATFSADLGLGMVATVAPNDQGVYQGTIEVALAGWRERTESAPMRAAFEDVQRRAALAAADALRRALAEGD